MYVHINLELRFDINNFITHMHVPWFVCTSTNFGLSDYIYIVYSQEFFVLHKPLLPLISVMLLISCKLLISHLIFYYSQGIFDHYVNFINAIFCL